jgi:hypothetical protein
MRERVSLSVRPVVSAISPTLAGFASYAPESCYEEALRARCLAHGGADREA